MCDPHRLQESLHSVIAGAGDTGPSLSRRTALAGCAYRRPAASVFRPTTRSLRN